MAKMAEKHLHRIGGVGVIVNYQDLDPRHRVM
ncbi:hypothetical protein LMG28138_05618 [Pararobbsia alpina]|uniref:Uncharacterized protein n=1 Tax=Pararobbsia alpina TaxID=621374 RepID=A0A6S7BLW2_9BURK|nr:hypothetical protein LMG28138_05618 [Pararobbsia alpina]